MSTKNYLQQEDIHCYTVFIYSAVALQIFFQSAYLIFLRDINRDFN